MKPSIPSLVVLVSILAGCGDAVVSTYTDASPQDGPQGDGPSRDVVDARSPRTPSVDEVEAVCRRVGMPYVAHSCELYPECPSELRCRVICLTPQGGMHVTPVACL